MSGYVLADVTWTNEDAREEYRSAFAASLERHGGHITCVTRDVRVAEGDWLPGGITVLVTFPTMDDALTWHDSDDYRPARELRQQAASSRVLIFGDES